MIFRLHDLVRVRMDSGREYAGRVGIVTHVNASYHVEHTIGAPHAHYHVVCIYDACDLEIA